MALSGAAKRDYQRVYMRERRARIKLEVQMAKMDYAKAKARTDGLRSYRAEQEALRSFDAEKAALAIFGPVTDTAEGYDILLKVAKERGFARGWAAHRFKERFGHWPRFTK